MVQSYNELALTAVAVQSANYTALPNTIVPCDVSGGPFAVTLPTAPEDRTEIILKIVKQTTPPTAPNALTFNLGGSDVLNIAGGSTSGTLTTLNNAVRLHYSASAAIWYAISTDVPLTALTSAIPASLVPAASNAYNLGSGADYWAAAFIEDLHVLAIFQGVTSTATAAATTTLTINSNQVQVFTGSTTQTVLLPTTSIPEGMPYLIINQSSGAVTVQSSGGNTIAVMGANTQGIFKSQKATPTAQNDWAGVVYTRGKAPIFDNSPEFAGTDGTKMTFPSTNATIARTDAGNTFTGHQTIEGVTSTGATGTGNLVFGTSPTLTTPALGTPASGILTNCTGLPLSGVISNPFNSFIPNDYGFIAWAYDPVFAYLADTVLPAGKQHLVLLPIRSATTITNVLLNVGVAGSGLTSGQCFAGLFDSSGNLLSATADQSTAWQSAGLQTMALSASQPVSVGVYYVGFFGNGTTMPKFNYSNVLNSSIARAGTLSASARFAIDNTNTGLTTAFHSPATHTSASTPYYWAGVS